MRNDREAARGGDDERDGGVPADYPPAADESADDELAGGEPADDELADDESADDELADDEPADDDRSGDEKLIPRAAPGIGPIGPAGDPAYMEGTLEGKGPRAGLYVTLGLVAALVLLAIVLVLRG